MKLSALMNTPESGLYSLKIPTNFLLNFTKNNIETQNMKKAILYIFSFLSVLLMGACSTNNSIERKSSDSVQLIRNATLKINYAGKTILVDPLFSGKGELRSILGVNRNPTVHLTMPIEEIVSGVDFALGTHSHIRPF